MIELFSLFFPLLLFALSLFFLYQSVSRLSSQSISGTIQSNSLTDYRGRPCAYSRLEISFHSGGLNPWKLIYTKDQRSKFTLNKKTIDLTNTDVRTEPTAVFVGKINYGPAVSDQILGVLSPITSMIPIRFWRNITNKEPTSEPYLATELSLALQKDPKLKNLLLKYRNQKLEIKEYLLTSGTKVCISTTNSNSEILTPFLLTTGESSTAVLVKEKSLITSLIGGGLLLLSLALLYLIFS
jgi:hypothetical protein